MRATTADLDLLAQFLIVAETASFSSAAKKLGVTKGTVSRGVARLESMLGAELLHRTTRQVALSTAGASLYERTAPQVAALRQALGTLPEREVRPSGNLRITAPVDLGSALLGEVSARFVARFPEVRLDVHLTNRRVDLVGEGFDLALRALPGLPKDSSMVARRVGQGEMAFYASTAYVARRGTPRTVGDDDHEWIWFRGLDPSDVGIKLARPARILCDDFYFLREAIRAGAGVGPLLPYIAEPAVTSGELVRVLTAHRVGRATLYLVYPSRKNVPRKVTAFRDFLLDWLRTHPLPKAAA
jgi:DNA-binding transcriptional LysR family regulator